VVGVTGNVAGVAVQNLPFAVGEAVPDGLPLAVFVPGPFDLIGGGGGSPVEPVGKADSAHDGLLAALATAPGLG
jgi:hypothetical protein